jgi:pyruvate/2-oxoglutarate dehydrogenase complex dihydrolipoamide dehydrogenase (E3) component
MVRRQKGSAMRKVATETLSGVVKNGTVHISKADDKRVFAKVRITTNTAKSSKKIEQILSAMGQYPNFDKVLAAVLKVEPNAYLTLKGGAR